MKKKWIPERDEFFIGYLPNAPAETAKFLRTTILASGILIVLIGVSLSLSQREFSSAEFEFGKFTTVEGIISKSPVPHIKLMGSDQSEKRNYQMVLLVSFGKWGADKTLATFENGLGNLEGSFVRLPGQRIFAHGKMLLQISSDHVPEIIAARDKAVPDSELSLGSVTIEGEIIDPKCFFGVMKPGEGKPHRSCAIRCIAGGIPPVIRLKDQSDFFILLDENRMPVNQLVLGMVGDNVTLQGRAAQMGDWKLLLLDSKHLREQALTSSLKKNLLAMESGITQCGMD
jgi:hypothetical protein